MPLDLLKAIEPFPTRDAERYDTAFLSGHVVEHYQVVLVDAAQRSVDQMNAALTAMCAQQIPGDTYRNLQIHPSFEGRTFKHVLVPVWVLAYVYGGTSPATGFDCSGFTRCVYAHFHRSLPHYSGAQWSLGRPVSRAGLRPGDLVFFSGLGHVGMYIGSGLFIHAPHTGASVEIDSLYGSYGGGYDGARRIL